MFSKIVAVALTLPGFSRDLGQQIIGTSGTCRDQGRRRTAAHMGLLRNWNWDYVGKSDWLVGFRLGSVLRVCISRSI